MDALAAHDAARASKQQTQDLKFVLGKFHAFALVRGGATRSIQSKASIGQLGAASVIVVAALEHHVYVGEKNLLVVGLGHKVIGTCREAHQLVQIGVAASHGNDGNLAYSTNLTTDKGAVDTRQVKVKKNKVACQVNDLLVKVCKACRHRRLIAVSLEQLAKTAANRRIVFYDTDPAHALLPSPKPA